MRRYWQLRALVGRLFRHLREIRNYHIGLLPSVLQQHIIIHLMLFAYWGRTHGDVRLVERRLAVLLFPVLHPPAATACSTSQPGSIDIVWEMVHVCLPGVTTFNN
jgi:hypothetical protein